MTSSSTQIILLLSSGLSHILVNVTPTRPIRIPVLLLWIACEEVVVPILGFRVELHDKIISISIAIYQEVAGSASGGCTYGTATGKTLGGVKSPQTIDEVQKNKVCRVDRSVKIHINLTSQLLSAREKLTV